MSAARELGNLAPIRGVLEWLDEQTDSIAAPPESVRLIEQIRRKLADALTDAENPELPDEGVTVEEYASLKRTTPNAIYMQIRRGKLQVKRQGRNISIPLAMDDAA